jgi:exonuclease III
MDHMGSLRKKLFLRELKNLKQSAHPHWLIMGDFNLIYQDHDKSNTRLNRRLMSRFRRTLNHLEVKEIQLVGKKFTCATCRIIQQ